MKYFDPDCIEFNINIAPGAPGSGEKRKKIYLNFLILRCYLDLRYIGCLKLWNFMLLSDHTVKD